MISRAALFLFALLSSLCFAGDAPGRGAQMDRGPFTSAAISDVPAPHFRDLFPKPGNANIACKGIALRLGNNAYLCFDADLLRMSFGWTGDFLNVKNTMLAETKGTLNPSIGGTLSFSTGMGPGWSADASFKDPRTFPFGPLLKTQAHYKGLYLCGDKVVLNYDIAGVDVLELPGATGQGSTQLFTRTFHIAPTKSPLSLRICDAQSGALVSKTSPAIASIDGEKSIRVTSTLEGAWLHATGSRIQLDLPALTKATTFTVAIWSGDKAAAENAPALFAPLLAAPAADLSALIKTDTTPRWGKPLVTHGTLGEAKGAFAFDTLTLPQPEDAPYKPWMRPTGIDFFPDGRAAVCTLDGDVWIVTGLDDKLASLSWQRFATGLFEPLGLRIVDGTVYVLGRDQITRLHDRNADGEADFYENFNNDGVASASYGGFAMDLVTDAAGNFYYGRSGHHGAETLPLNNGIYRIAKDGSKLETFASGMRVPNGMGIGPNGEFTYGDNQGNYVPASKISLVKQGGYYGYQMEPNARQTPKEYIQPMLWLPQSMDSSSGSQIWIPADAWGGAAVLGERMLHTSYGKAKLFLVLSETVDGQTQAAAAPFPFAFESGIMRGRFNPIDKQFYTCGVGGGWQAGGPKFGCLTRVRYTAKPLALPTAFHVKKDALELTFAQPLDKSAATDVENYSAEQWNYLYSWTYGSPEFSVADPKKKAHDPVEIKSAKLSDDGKTIRLEIPGLAPVMQFMLKYKLSAADKSPIASELYATIHRVPK